MKRRKQSKKKINQLRSLVEELEHIIPTDPSSQGEKNFKRTTFHIPPELEAQLNELAISIGPTKAEVIRDALQMFQHIDSKLLSSKNASFLRQSDVAYLAFTAQLLLGFFGQHPKYPKPKRATKPGQPRVIAEKAIPTKRRLTNEELTVLIGFLTLLIAIWQLVQSSQPTQIAQSQINQLIRAYEHVVMEAKRNPPIDTHYSVVRPVALKVKPIHHSTTVRLLLPSQTLLMIQKKHKWIYVEYLDSNNRVTYYGWVDKKYLRRMEVSPTD